MEVFRDYRKVKVLNGTIERYIIVCISCLVKKGSDHPLRVGLPLLSSILNHVK